MDTLPVELVELILLGVNDKVYSGMVCKKWGMILDDMYTKGKINDINNPYYIKTLWNPKCVSYGIINDIVNHKCLKYIFYYSKQHNSNPHILSYLFYQNYTVGNINNQYDMLYLAHNCHLLHREHIIRIYLNIYMHI
jgi:hypothetical protein